MNMNDIWITCDVIIDSYPFVGTMSNIDIWIILSILFVAITVIGVTVFAIIKLVKLLKSNKHIENIDSEQSVSTAQKDDIEQLK